jgi:rhodanese-related sulfurtransferase
MMQKRNLAIVVAILVAAISFSGLAVAAEQKAPAYPPEVGQLVASAKKSIKSIDMAALKTVMDQGEEMTVLDVREPNEYEAGHIPGAINIPRGVLEFKVWKMVAGFPENTDTSKKIYIHCKSGGRAALATKSLQDLGFTNVVLVDMKIAEWIKAGYPVER